MGTHGDAAFAPTSRDNEYRSGSELITVKSTHQNNHKKAATIVTTIQADFGWCGTWGTTRLWATRIRRRWQRSGTSSPSTSTRTRTVLSPSTNSGSVSRASVRPKPKKNPPAGLQKKLPGRHYFEPFVFIRCSHTFLSAWCLMMHAVWCSLRRVHPYRMPDCGLLDCCSPKGEKVEHKTSNCSFSSLRSAAVARFAPSGIEAKLDTEIGFEAPYTWTVKQWITELQSVLNRSVRGRGFVRLVGNPRFWPEFGPSLAQVWPEFGRLVSGAVRSVDKNGHACKPRPWQPSCSRLSV